MCSDALFEGPGRSDKKKLTRAAPELKGKPEGPTGCPLWNRQFIH